MSKKIRKFFLYGVLGLVAVCLVSVGWFSWSNQSLPTYSTVTDRISDLEKARLAEVFHLRETLGNAVWSGWGEQDIPIIVYNEAYAFLVGYADPPTGWERMPQQEQRGGAWEAVPDDLFEGKVYYRQLLPDPEITPENFTVRVGEHWAATLQTKEYAEIRFYEDFRDELPVVVQDVFPYRLMWGLIMADTETYIGGLEHEAFHAFQGAQAPERLAASEFANRNESQYPWEQAALDEMWKQEIDLLIQAVRVSSDAQAFELARQFLAQRDHRRAELGLNQALVDYERQREWLEGLAKYAEVTIQRLAGATSGYTPVPALAIDPEFKGYANQEQFWSGQIDEARRTAGRGGETRFYYSGMVQAVVLDRLLPDWKAQAFEPDVMLEVLLREAVTDLESE